MKFLREGSRTNRDWFGTPDEKAAEMAATLEPLGYVRRKADERRTYAEWSKRVGNMKVVVTGYGSDSGGVSPYLKEADGAMWVVTIGKAGSNGRESTGNRRIPDVFEAAKLAEDTAKKIPTMDGFKDIDETEYERLDKNMADELKAYYGRGPGSYTGD